jgi:hypothetical protein
LQDKQLVSANANALFHQIVYIYSIIKLTLTMMRQVIAILALAVATLEAFPMPISWNDLTGLCHIEHVDFILYFKVTWSVDPNNINAFVRMPRDTNKDHRMGFQPCNGAAVCSCSKG